MSEATTLPWAWLLDNCRCSKCINQDTLQRQIKTFGGDIPHDIQAVNIRQENEKVQIKWNTGHESEYTWDFIAHYAMKETRSRPVWDHISRSHKYWGSQGPMRSSSTLKYDDVMASDEGIRGMLNSIIVHGLVFVHDTPHENAEATQKLLERIAFIRETHYGGFYDFIPDLAMADTAYTNLALGAHTDTTYFTDPAGLQAFHMLSHTPAPGETKVSGGASLLVDGFGAAKMMQKSHPNLFKRLVKTGLPWHASGNEGISITPNKLYPVIELDPFGEPHRIRWNNDDRGVVPMGEEDDAAHLAVEEWYEAAQVWNNILTSKDSEYWVQLKPGTVLIFDNWRVLHGRSAFIGVRRICGGYINRDDWMSRWRTLNILNKEDLLRRVVG